MKRNSYREQDYAFGQRMLALRSAIGLTQAGLAKLLGVSRQSVAEWEAGGKYPKARHLQALLELAMQHQALPAGHEAPEIRTLWKASHQKVLLDESWLNTLLSGGSTTGSIREETFQDEALEADTFYGREEEIRLLHEWVIEDRARIVTLLGMGGIGKSSLALHIMQEFAPTFDRVLWHSLRDAPACENLLDDLLQDFDAYVDEEVVTLELRLDLLLERLRQQRVLLVLDNAESLMEEGSEAGQLRAGYDGYLHLLRRLAEDQHQSCLLLTSREKPQELTTLEGRNTSLRSLRLTPLDLDACQHLLAEKGIIGTLPEYTRLIESYAGNPLALKIVTQTIVDLFGGEIMPFLEHGATIFGGVRVLLAGQFERLSGIEQIVLLWLAILREPTSIAGLSAVLVTPVPRVQVLETLDALYRRSLIERAQQAGSFTLQSVVLEYLTTRLIDELSEELEQRRLGRLAQHGLELATSPEYVRQTQRRLIIAPLLAHLSLSHFQPTELETLLLGWLNRLRELPESAHGYAPANIIALLHQLRGHLRGLDLSRLVLRSVTLQEVDVQDSNLAGALLQNSTYTEAFEPVTSLSISASGEYLAISTRTGEVRVWETANFTLHRVWDATTTLGGNVALSMDGHWLACGCHGGPLKFLDVTSGKVLWAFNREHLNSVPWNTGFSPDGSSFFTADVDGSVNIWDPAQGILLRTLQHPQLAPAVSWRHDGEVIATGDMGGVIYFWSIQQGTPSEILFSFKAHIHRVACIAFSPDGQRLVSCSWDGTVKIWSASSGELLEALTAHRDRVQRVAWSADGRTIASVGRDKVIWLWDVQERRYRAALRGHTAVSRGLAFTPDSRRLISGCDDGTIRVWDVATGTGMRMLQGYANLLWYLSWSPDSQRMISAGSDINLTLHSLQGDHPPRILRGHALPNASVVWHPKSDLVASNAMSENVIRLWDGKTGEALGSLYVPDEPEIEFRIMSWTPDGKYLAAGSRNRGAYLFDITTRTPVLFMKDNASTMQHLVWSHDGKLIAGLGDNGLYVWAAASDTLLFEVDGPYDNLDWSSDSRFLMSRDNTSGSGVVVVWEGATGTPVPVNITNKMPITHLRWAVNDSLLIIGDRDGWLHWWDFKAGVLLWEFKAHEGYVGGLKLNHDGTLIASCGDDGFILIWDVPTGKLVRSLRRDRPYERVNITGIRGLTDAQKETLLTLGAFEDQPANL